MPFIWPVFSLFIENIGIINASSIPTCSNPQPSKENMTPIVWTYLAYLVISIALTIWVAATLHKNGRIFLVDSFLGNEALADSVNHLLVVGFYLVNLGFVSLALRTAEKPADLQGVLETLSGKIGWVLLILGFMHFFNLFVFSRMRKRALLHHAPPPVPPQAYVEKVSP